MEIPLSDYPRPQLMRDSYMCLNGEWSYEIIGEKPINGTIIVPYSPETEASTVGHILQPDETLIYRRHVEFRDEFDHAEDFLILHFDAVDYEAKVLIDGEERVHHYGGYLPFEIQIHNKLAFDLEVIVRDPSDTAEQERGKQKLRNGGIWYTPQSGIWQSVWIEKVRNGYIRQIKLEPELRGFFITAYTDSKELWLSIDGKKHRISGNERAFIEISNPRLWSPDDPFIYHFTLETESDRIRSYVGLRVFGVTDEGLTLNGKKIFHHGILDQGYYKEGLYTPLSYDEMKNDILLIKKLGFNTIRKHIKIEPLRWYYYADTIGILVWQDMVNGGGKYNPAAVKAPLAIGSFIKDTKHHGFLSRTDNEMMERWEENAAETIKHLFNPASIALWTIFNEGWGQYDSERILEKLRRIDRSRPFDSDSGWHDQGLEPFKSLHIYFRPYRYRKDRKNRVTILSEFGGYGLRVPGHSPESHTFVYKKLSTKEELTEAICKLYEKEIIPAKQKGLAASIYTQLSDVEEEVNGMITFDRKEVKVIPEKIREISWKLLGEQQKSLS